VAGVATAVAVLTAGGTTMPAAADPAPAAPAAPAHPTISDLSRLQSSLAEATRQSQLAAADAQHAAAERVGLRVARDRAADTLAAARHELGQDVRRLYIAGANDPLQQIVGISPDLTGLSRVRTSVMSIDTRLLDRTRAADRELARLQQAADADRRRVLARAAVVEAAQERARALLDQAMSAWAKDQVAQAYLKALQRKLDDEARQVAAAVAPVWETPAGPAQPLGDQEATVRLLENTPPGQLPAGYHLTGQVLNGIASWYGPGFVGHPTSTGVPYDPERLTAAMLAVPLGTVVRVSANGTSVDVLVNDHGPYVGGRIIDLSHRAAQLLGIGLGPVTVEVLSKN
jgi:3D (Asp-Asp-Asp) domain-containing protein